MIQGSIYIYAMDGTPLVTGDPAQAMAINSKIGIVNGLTLDPIKKVHEFDLIAKKNVLNFTIPICFLTLTC